MSHASGGKRSIAFFASDVTDVSTIKRAEAFLDGGLQVAMLGFRRSRYNRDYRPPWSYFELGRATDGNYLRRLRSLFLAIGILFKARGHLRRADWFYARNIDQLLLALLAKFLFRPGVQVAYEVLDVQPAFVRKGIGARFLRLVERLCLFQVELLVVSSPGFVRNYFEPVQRYRGKWFLLENKLHASAVPALSAARQEISRRPPPAHGYKWVVSYIGIIRGEATLELIDRLAARFRNDILFKFHGILTTVDPAKFEAALERNPNMVYCGEYVNPRDLAEIYSDADFVWALDLENVDTNSRWLLPCRFYEAGFLGRPCLAARDFEIGRKIDRLDAGWTFAEPFEEALADFFSTVTPEDREEKCRQLARLPVSTFIAGEDATALCHFLSDDTPTLKLKRSRQTRDARPHHLTPHDPTAAECPEPEKYRGAEIFPEF